MSDEAAIRSAPLPPGWDEPARLDEPPATVPDPADVEVPAELRAEIEGYMARYPERHSAALPGARRRPEGPRLVLARGDPPGGRGDAGHARLPVGGRHVLRHAAHPADAAAATCTSAPAWPATCADAKAVYDAIAAEAREQGLEDVEVREFECLGACDLAPMASIDGRYVGPLATDDAGRAGAGAQGGPRPVPGPRAG